MHEGSVCAPKDPDYTAPTWQFHEASCACCAPQFYILCSIRSTSFSLTYINAAKTSTPTNQILNFGKKEGFWVGISGRNVMQCWGRQQRSPPYPFNTPKSSLSIPVGGRLFLLQPNCCPGIYSCVLLAVSAVGSPDAYN